MTEKIRNRDQETEEQLDRLYELLDQQQFELLPPFDEGKIRLVYLMNDAVESFLVFEEAVLTGTYQENYEGELEAELRLEKDGRYVLIIAQGETVCTLFFRRLSLEVQLYNYGKTGHVWMKGHEELRQIEYWIAIMKAKREYLGEAYCNAAELQLTALEEFPPLNCYSYPAVPRKYFEPREDAGIPSKEGILTMQRIAEEADDQRLIQVLERYKRKNGPQRTKNLAELFCRNAHSKVVQLLTEKILQAAAEYPDRVFAPEEECRYAAIVKEAESRRAQLRSEGKEVLLFSQMPFVTARDEVEYKVHLLVMSRGLLHRKVEVETFLQEQ
ncbi:MAG: DUF3878 family protein [Eubacteriales bacterium]|nr:DUF3878 family protein [Eubacteriales bacterium]